MGEQIDSNSTHASRVDIDENGALKAPENFSLDPEATVSPETWFKIAREVYRLNENQDPYVHFTTEGIDGFIKYPTERSEFIDILAGQAGQTTDAVIRLHFGHWLKAQEQIDGRQVTHISLDLRRPGYLKARDKAVSYPDRMPIMPRFAGKVDEEETGGYLTSTGDTIQYVKQDYVITDDGGKQLVALLSLGNLQDGQEQDENFITRLDDLEPGLCQACRRYFVEGKSLVFDPEKEFKVEWQEINNPFTNSGTALLADLPGRVELYLAPTQNPNKKPDLYAEKWFKLVWRKEDFSDRFFIDQEGESELVELSLQEVLESVPVEQRAYIQKMEVDRLRYWVMMMQRDSLGYRPITPETEPQVRANYRILYQRYMEVFPDDEFNLLPELPD